MFQAACANLPVMQEVHDASKLLLLQYSYMQSFCRDSVSEVTLPPCLCIGAVVHMYASLWKQLPQFCLLCIPDAQVHRA